MARRKKGRSINGILLLDKPLGISSNDALQRVKRAFNAAKAGHTGALDPLATGMLPICLGEATKFSQFLLETDKTYEVTAKLGFRTTTSDADGEIVEQHDVSVSPEQIERAVDSFRGESKQIPSMYSALKHQGKPLYYYARQGIEIEREARDITMYSIVIDRFVDDEADMTVHCSKGTYIRSFVDDLGQVLGCGAYVSKLHRSRVADYPRENMITLETLEHIAEQAKNEGLDDFAEIDSFLLPMDTAAKGLGQVTLDASTIMPFQNGNPVVCSEALAFQEGDQVRVYSESPACFLGVAIIDQNAMVAPKRLVVFEQPESEDNQ